MQVHPGHCYFEVGARGGGGGGGENWVWIIDVSLILYLIIHLIIHYSVIIVMPFPNIGWSACPTVVAILPWNTLQKSRHCLYETRKLGGICSQPLMAYKGLH
jgi:hypothetical protein